MPAIANLWCSQCKHSMKIGEKWFEINAPSLVNMAPEVLFSELIAMKDQLVCSKCGERSILVYPPSSTSLEQSQFVPNEGETASIPEILHKLIAKKVWLFGGELRIVRSMESQVKLGQALTTRQQSTLERIEGRIEKRKDIRVVSGGAPGTGKRR